MVRTIVLYILSTSSKVHNLQHSVFSVHSSQQTLLYLKEQTQCRIVSLATSISHNQPTLRPETKPPLLQNENYTEPKLHCR